MRQAMVTHHQYPLFWCLTPIEQAGLVKYQGVRHRKKLIPPPPPGVNATVWNSAWDNAYEDAAKTMSRAPESQTEGKTW